MIKTIPCNIMQVGSADHHIHYYDLRNTCHPIHVFSGHKKAVSYVKFLSDNELASASTDSTLRLWDVKENSLVRFTTMDRFFIKHFNTSCNSHQRSIFYFFFAGQYTFFLVVTLIFW